MRRRPPSSFKAVQKRARDVRLIIMDVDGVLTPGDIVILASGEEIKSWNVKDRFGFALARQSGHPFLFAWISGRTSGAVARAAQELKIDALAMGVKDKRRAYEDIKKRLGVKDREAAFIGDDLMDLPVLLKVGLACCPEDASLDVKSHVHYVARAPGGRGVFREIIELVVKSTGLWKRLFDVYST